MDLYVLHDKLKWVFCLYPVWESWGDPPPKVNRKELIQPRNLNRGFLLMILGAIQTEVYKDKRSEGEQNEYSTEAGLYQ